MKIVHVFVLSCLKVEPAHVLYKITCSMKVLLSSLQFEQFWLYKSEKGMVNTVFL